MNTNRHIDIVGYLHLAYGAFLLVMAIVVVIGALVGSLFTFDVLGVFATLLHGAWAGLILLLIALPSLAGGFGLLRRMNWARSLVIVMSLVALFSFPIGTALGIYSLWALLRSEAPPEFS